jgi:hypothetical protein
MNIKSFMPQWKLLLSFFALLFISGFAAARAGLTTRAALGPVFLGLGALQRIGVMKSIPFLGTLPNTYEIGIAMILYEVFIMKTFALQELPGIYQRMVTGTGAATSQPALTITGIGV